MWLARDKRRAREVAIKVLSAGPAAARRTGSRAGALPGIGYILVAPDGKSYAHSVTCDFSDMFIVAGPK